MSEQLAVPLAGWDESGPIGLPRLVVIGVPAQLGLDFGVLILASAVMISIASALLARLAR